MVGMIYHDSIN